MIAEKWCGFCGAILAYSPEVEARMYVVPPCPRCGEKDWRDEIDELTAPDYREMP